jgi:Domain of unknown function (DUF4118)
VQLKLHDLERPEPAANHLVWSLAERFERVSGEEARSCVGRVALAVIVVAVTTAAISLLAPIVDLRHMLALYLIPVLAATLRWGFAIGLVTTALSAIAAAFFFFDPIFSFYVSNPVEIVGLLIFVAAAIVVGYLATELRAARAHPIDGQVPSITLSASSAVPSGADAQASPGTVPARVKDFIVQSAGAAFCDGCIQDRLGLKWRQQVQLITATLAVTHSFRREHGVCSACSERKQVIRAVRFS